VLFGAYDGYEIVSFDDQIGAARLGGRARPGVDPFSHRGPGALVHRRASASRMRDGQIIHRVHLMRRYARAPVAMEDVLWGAGWRNRQQPVEQISRSGVTCRYSTPTRGLAGDDTVQFHRQRTASRSTISQTERSERIRLIYGRIWLLERVKDATATSRVLKRTAPRDTNPVRYPGRRFHFFTLPPRRAIQRYAMKSILSEIKIQHERISAPASAKAKGFEGTSRKCFGRSGGPVQALSAAAAALHCRRKLTRVLSARRGWLHASTHATDVPTPTLPRSAPFEREAGSGVGAVWGGDRGVGRWVSEMWAWYTRAALRDGRNPVSTNRSYIAHYPSYRVRR
jgi:hypothetical protein